jgi:hypothetical protein
MPAPDPISVFDHVYAERPPHLERQRAEMMERLAEVAPGRGQDDDAVSPPMRGQRRTRR